MLREDREALICDLAETYGIFDYHAFPAQLLGTLASGLRDDSRIKISLSGVKATRSEILLAAAVDRLSLLVWSMTAAGQKGINRPASVLDIIMGQDKQQGDTVAFTTVEEYETEWERITGVKHV